MPWPAVLFVSYRHTHWSGAVKEKNNNAVVAYRPIWIIRFFFSIDNSFTNKRLQCLYRQPLYPCSVFPLRIALLINLSLILLFSCFYLNVQKPRPQSRPRPLKPKKEWLHSLLSTFYPRFAPKYYPIGI